MRFISLQENLKRGLNIVGHITTKNINLPILNNILIKAEGGNIELVGTNLEIGIVHQLRGKVEKDGQFTVDAKLITEYISLLGGEDKVKIEEKEKELKVECGNYKTKIKGDSAKEFPLIPVIPKKGYYYCSAEEFRKALVSVIFAASNSENRMELTGVLFSFKKDRLSLVATDSYRLAEKEIKVGLFEESPDKEKSATTDEGEQNEQKLIVPSKTAQEILRILNNWNSAAADDEEKIKIYLSENQILFTVDSVDLISRLINGQYPDYKQVIPSKSQTEVLVDRAEIIRAIKAAALFSKTGINDVSLKFLSGKILVSSYSGISGESQIEVEAEITGVDNEITVNHRYLNDGLNNIEGERVKISILNSDTPCIIRPEKENGYLYIVMPIRQ